MNHPTRPAKADQLASFYLSAKERVIEAGFADEVDWQADIVREDWDEPTFLRESAWVVLSSGFRESAVRRRFPLVSASFLDWVAATSIMSQRAACRSNALQAFGNERKIDAILRIVQRVAADGIEAIRQGIRNGGTAFLQQLPFIGPVTACHLAKNLGMPIVKPDRHLSRLAQRNGYESAEHMCQTIAAIVGDSVPVIDIVIWRYATITDNYDGEFGDYRQHQCVNRPSLSRR